jgi:hypothetical protein
VKINIPERIEQLLAKSDLFAGVTASLAEFAIWLSSERPPFFPEYTNHGISHIQDVFQTAESLIRDESWGVFTPSDAGTMLLACLLHDAAMHLTPDSFIALIKKHHKEYIINDLDTKTWDQLWDEFLAQASRFDGRKLQDLFGSSDPVHPPPLEPDKMTERDLKLIGEFLRQYHHRLAHEIAVFGVPGPTEKRISLQSIPKDIADIAGLVARSHGMPVRSCMAYLQEKYNNKCEHKDVHAIFLMTLLRVSDYLQIHSERAPHLFLKVKTLRSPVSKKHWDIHHAINDIRITHPDPEAIEIHALPQNVVTFLKIKQLLEDIQSELDSSWAILGEVYGRMKDNKLHLLGLRYRRIRSNLDNMQAFAKQVAYIPVQAAFDSAGSDLLKLLIKPLYGDNPSYGIRELIQNAVDSVRERREYEKHHNIKNLDLAEQKADVVVSLDKDEKDELWLTVSDNGIGMSADTIRNYFLRAGASFRNSDAWKKEFVDDKGRSRVFRSGRFGIGVLAAFLVGDSIEVTTRHISSSPQEAISFETTLEEKSISLLRIRRSIGTTVKVKVNSRFSTKYTLNVIDPNDAAHDHEKRILLEKSWQFLADWYCLSEPSVSILINGNQISQRFSLPNSASVLAPEWRKFSSLEFSEIHWTHHYVAPHLVCNGLSIGTKKSYSDSFRDPYGDSSSQFIDGTYFRIPNLSVFDSDQFLPLNLQRTELNSRLPFHDQLQAEVIKDFLAYVLVFGPTYHFLRASGYKQTNFMMSYPGGSFVLPRFALKTISMAPWFFTKTGFSLVDSRNIREVNLQSSLLLLYNESFPPKTPDVAIPDTNCSLFWRTTWGMDIPWLQFSRFALRASNICQMSPSYSAVWPNIRASRVLLPINQLETITGPSGLSKAVRTAIEIEQKNNRWILLRFGSCPEPTVDLLRVFSIVSKQFPVHYQNAFAEWYFEDTPPETQSSPFAPIAEAWRKIIREPVIPYDPAERRKKLSHAFSELAPFIEANEKLLEQQAAQNKKSK